MVEIRIGDAVQLIGEMADGSVDLIFTDPPYEREYLPLYGWLAEQAARVLKADGFLLVYTGGYHKATVMTMLGRSMEFFWDYVEIHSGVSSVIHPRRTVARYKSILAYRKQGSTALPAIGNVLGAFDMVGGYDKRYHRWGQSENTARYLIECFSKPGELVLDPFVGGGTTPYVCSRIGRRFIGFEIEAEVAEIARSRVAGWQPAPRQLPLWEEVVDSQDWGLPPPKKGAREEEKDRGAGQKWRLRIRRLIGIKNSFLVGVFILRRIGICDIFET